MAQTDSDRSIPTPLMTQLRWMTPYFRKYRRRLLVALLGVIVFNLLAVTPPLIFRYLIDSVVELGQWERLASVVALCALVPVLSQVL